MVRLSSTRSFGGKDACGSWLTGTKNSDFSNSLQPSHKAPEVAAVSLRINGNPFDIVRP
jgi:hypothetical protein